MSRLLRNLVKRRWKRAFELGQRLLAKKEVQQSIPLLQQAAADKRFKAQALVSLGEAFLADRKGPLAKRQFLTALELLNPQDQQDDFCKSHYALGRLAEAAKNYQEAEKHYGEVLGVNYNYRDANDRLTAIAEKAEAA